MKQRQSGVLMHISSLPNDYGIGSFGQSAYEFVDFLVATKQRYWQILPLGTTSYGDSPYQSFSAFAGNTHFIDLDKLVEEGLLLKEEVSGINFGDNPLTVDYARIFEVRRPLLEQAVKRFKAQGYAQDYHNFIEENVHWLADFSQYMAIKEHFNLVSWLEWEDEAIKYRQPEALAHYTHLLKDQIEYHHITQYLFFKQWLALKAYANQHYIEIIGDMPIYVASDSAEMWATPHYFKTDEQRRPSWVAGVPPDDFSAEGQLWGNPIYDWQVMADDHYAWWVRRMKESFKIYDMVRIDHFRGFESFWQVPYGEKTAVNGKWVKGPGLALFDAIKSQLGELNIIAEDLGFMTQEVIDVREGTGFPGMKVLQFGFDPYHDSVELPHNYTNNSVAYTGTHDNETINGWYEDAINDEVRQYCNHYINRSSDETICHAMLRTIFSSVSFLAIATMQDVLNLDGKTRMNLPSTLGGNWTWRMAKDALTQQVIDELSDLTTTYRRTNIHFK